MTVPPEIKRLRNEAAATVVALSLAEQAVRDAEARVGAQVSWLDPPAFVYFCRCGHLGVGENHRCPDPSNEPSIRYAPQGVAGTWPDQSAQHAVLLEQVKDARREAFREAVEALREDAVMEAAMQHDDVAAMQRYAADFLERRFFTSEGGSDADVSCKAGGCSARWSSKENPTMIENRYDEFECDDIREAEGYASPSLEGRPFSGVPDSVIDAAEDAYVRECGELPVRDAMRLAVCRALALTTGEPDDA